MKLGAIARAVFATTLAVGCGSVPRSTPDAAFRAHPPEATPTTFTPPPIEVATLSNGIRVLFVARRDFPIVSVDIVFENGSSDFDDVRPEAFELMNAMLEAGSSTSEQIARRYGAIGAEHRTWIDFDSAGAGAKVTTSSLDAAIDVLADLVERPSFTSDAFERVRSQAITRSTQQTATADDRARAALAASVYGRDHPYAHVVPRASALAATTLDEVMLAYTHAIAPSRATVVAAGDVSMATLVPKLEVAFGRWMAAPPAPSRVPPPPVDSNARVVLCDVRTTQPAVLVGEPSIAYGAPERIEFVVMNEIVGGAYSSRIFRNLREEHGYTYAAFSQLSAHHGVGIFSAGGAIDAAHVGDAIRELLREMTAIRERDVTADELARAKEHLIHSYPARFASVASITRLLAQIAVHRSPLDEWATFAARVGAVRIEDVRAVARAHVHPDRMKIVVAGNRSTLVPMLASLGLGPVEIVDAEGRVVAP